jgi:hypothetical protein
MTTIGELLQQRLIEDQHLQDELKLLRQETSIEVMKWEATCWMGRGDYFVVLLDPTTGKLLLNNGRGLYAGRTRLDH